MELPGLSFRPGVGVQAAVLQKFGLSVTSSGSSRGAFFLVTSFGRCKFRLCPPSVGLILQATIGGSALDFAVSLDGPGSRALGSFIYDPG